MTLGREREVLLSKAKPRNCRDAEPATLATAREGRANYQFIALRIGNATERNRENQKAAQTRNG